MSEPLFEALSSIILYGSIGIFGLTARWYAKNRKRLKQRSTFIKYRKVTKSGNAEGPIAISGTANVLSEELNTPIENSNVLAYRLIVGQRRVSRGGIENIRVLFDECKSVEFQLSHKNDEYLIRPHAGRVIINREIYVYYAQGREDVPDYINQELANNHVTLQEGLDNNVNVLYVEQTIMDGAPVTIYGTCNNIVDSNEMNVNYREPALKPEITGDEKLDLIITYGDNGKPWKTKTAKQILGG